MPLRLNWFPWMETKIWWSIRSWTARLQDVSLFLLSWRLNCHFLPEVEATPPSVLLLFSADSGWTSAMLLLLAGFDVEVVEMGTGSGSPSCCLSSAVGSVGSSGNKGSVQYWFCTAERTKLPLILFKVIFWLSSTYLHLYPEELHVPPCCWVLLQSPRSLHCCGSHCSPWW